MPSKNSSNYDSVLFEQMNAKFDLIMEGMTSMEQRLNKRIDERFAKHDAHFDIIEGVLHQHSLHFTRIESRLDKVELRLDGVELRLDRVESRLNRVETKLDDVCSTIKRHDNDIRTLQASIH